MLAGIYNITCEQGSTFERSIVWRQRSRLPKNLTGYSARMTVRPFATSEDAILELTSSGNDITFVTPTAGLFKITIAAAATAELTPQVGEYDLELESPTGVVTRLLRGTFTITAEVTR